MGEDPASVFKKWWEEIIPILEKEGFLGVVWDITKYYLPKVQNRLGKLPEDAQRAVLDFLEKLAEFAKKNPKANISDFLLWLKKLQDGDYEEVEKEILSRLQLYDNDSLKRHLGKEARGVWNSFHQIFFLLAGRPALLGSALRTYSWRGPFINTLIPPKGILKTYLERNTPPPPFLSDLVGFKENPSVKNALKELPWERLKEILEETAGRNRVVAVNFAHFLSSIFPEHTDEVQAWIRGQVERSLQEAANSRLNKFGAQLLTEAPCLTEDPRLTAKVLSTLLVRYPLDKIKEMLEELLENIWKVWKIKVPEIPIYLSELEKERLSAELNRIATTLQTLDQASE